MKMMLKRLLSVLVTAMMLVSLVPAAAFAGSGPKMFTGDYSNPDSGFAYIRFGDTTIFGLDWNTNDNVSPADGHYLYETSGGNGFIKFDPDTNTIYMGGINEPGKVLDINMMGEDLSLFIEDENTIAGITVWGDAWGGSLKVTTGMSGKLTAATRGIRIEGENSNSVLTVEQDVTLDLTNSYNDFGAVSVAGTSAASGGIVINGTLAQVDGQTPEIIRTVVPTEVGHYDAATEQWISDGTIDLYTYALGKGEEGRSVLFLLQVELLVGLVVLAMDDVVEAEPQALVVVMGGVLQQRCDFLFSIIVFLVLDECARLANLPSLGQNGTEGMHQHDK